MSLLIGRFGNEKESFRKLTAFVKNPSQFFSKNKETDETLIDFTSFLIRLGALIRFLLDIGLQRETFLSSILYLAFALVFAPVGASIGLWLFSLIINFFAKLFSNNDNRRAAKRIVAYAYTIAILLSQFSFIEKIVSVILLIILVIIITIGVSKQYKLSVLRSFIIAMAPIIAVYLLSSLVSILAKL